MAYLVQIGQRKQRKNLRRVLLQSPIPGLDVAELALDHPKRMLHLGPYTGQFDTERPIVSTGDMRTWYTGKPCEFTKRSHINFCVFDSTWEASDEFEMDRNKNVDAWVKNDHLEYEVLYVFKGVVHKYRPDFIIRLKTGNFLVLETKGQDTDQDKTKRTFLDEWIKAVNEHGGFGKWRWAVARKPGDVVDILEQCGRKL